MRIHLESLHSPNQNKNYMSTLDDHEILYFKMQLLQAEIHMNAMIAENKQREHLGQSMAYTDADFVQLIDQFGIHHNKFPAYTGQ